MPEEIWKDIPSHPGYQVSSLGQVRRGDKILEQSFAGGGYPTITASVEILRSYEDGGNFRASRRVGVHILVCETFHCKRPLGKPLALHKDDNSRNNRESNLYWGSKKDNGEDRRRNRLKNG